MDPLLLEETVEWQQKLDWDFALSADLVRQFTDMRALKGFALLDRGEIVGYGYSVLEDHKGLVGDLYVRPPWRDGITEARLFQAILDDLIGTPHIRRVESQLLLVGPEMGEVLQRERSVEGSGASADVIGCRFRAVLADRRGRWTLPYRTLGRTPPRIRGRGNRTCLHQSHRQPDQRSVPYPGWGAQVYL